MLNDIDFDYPDLGLPNLVWARPKNSPTKAAPRLHEALKEFAFAAAKKFPKWKIVADGEVQNTFMSLKVYEGREKVGDVGFTHTRKGTKITIGSRRLKGKLKYKQTVETSDHKKALRIMKESFGAKTTQEIVVEARGDMTSALDNMRSATNGAYKSAANVTMQALEEYVLSEFAAMSKVAIQGGANADKVHSMPELRQRRDVVNTVTSKFINNQGIMVVLFGSSYILDDGINPPLTVTQELLPEKIRRKVGMLKLVNNNTAINSVGYRRSDTCFFVTDEDITEGE